MSFNGYNLQRIDYLHLLLYCNNKDLYNTPLSLSQMTFEEIFKKLKSENER
jgi:hypothetical protein